MSTYIFIFLITVAILIGHYGKTAVPFERLLSWLRICSRVGNCYFYWVNIRLFEYKLLTVQTHIIYAIFFWQLVNETAVCFNNIVFIFVAVIHFLCQYRFLTECYFRLFRSTSLVSIAKLLSLVISNIASFIKF